MPRENTLHNYEKPLAGFAFDPDFVGKNQRQIKNKVFFASMMPMLRRQ